jgi:integrase
MSDNTAIVKKSEPIPALPVGTDYGQDMQQASHLAQQFRQLSSNPFQEYHEKSTPNTRARQRFDLLNFTAYLAGAGVQRTVEQLYHDAAAWAGISEPLVFGYRAWLRQEGYAIGTINLRLATIRAYCDLARQVGAISEQEYKLIQTVKGYSYKEGCNIDATRTEQGQPTRKSTKKAMPASVSIKQALRLKKATTQIDRKRRPRDIALSTKDALMMGLFIEHAFRVGEVVALNIEQFDLVAGTVSIYRQKTKNWQTHQLKRHTRMALDDYLAAEGRTSGPLLLGYASKKKQAGDRRITRYGIYDRVRLLGQQVGIPNLSPHDLRHYWTIDALTNGTSIDRVQAGGNWTTPFMVLRYAKKLGIANEGVMITEAEESDLPLS